MIKNDHRIIGFYYRLHGTHGSDRRNRLVLSGARYTIRVFGRIDRLSTEWRDIGSVAWGFNRATPTGGGSNLTSTTVSDKPTSRIGEMCFCLLV